MESVVSIAICPGGGETSWTTVDSWEVSSRFLRLYSIDGRRDSSWPINTYSLDGREGLILAHWAVKSWQLGGIPLVHQDCTVSTDRRDSSWPIETFLLAHQDCTVLTARRVPPSRQDCTVSTANRDSSQPSRLYISFLPIVKTVQYWQPREIHLTCWDFTSQLARRNFSWPLRLYSLDGQ